MAAQVLGRRKLSPLLMKGTLCILYSKPDKPHHVRRGITWPWWPHGAIHEDIGEKQTQKEHLKFTDFDNMIKFLDED